MMPGRYVLTQHSWKAGLQQNVCSCILVPCVPQVAETCGSWSSTWCENNVIEPTKPPSSSEIVGSVQPLPHVYLWTLAVRHPCPSVTNLLDSEHCRSRKPHKTCKNLMGQRLSWVKVGDVAQWKSVCLPCLRSWVQTPASPNQRLPS